MSIAGKDTTWKHATHGAPSTNTNYTTNTRSVNLSLDGEEVDATTFGDAYREFEQSFKSAEITVQYTYSTAMWTVITDLYNNGTSVTWELSPIGTTASNPKVTGSMVCRTLSLPYNVGDLQVLDVTFRATGAVVFATH